MSTLKIFSHNGIVGAESDLNGEGIINDPFDDNQLGVVVNVEHVSITKEAKELIRKSKKDGGSFAPLMLTKHANPSEHGEASVGVLGFWKHMLGETNGLIGRTCSVEVLDLIKEEEIEIPQEFIEVVEGN